MKKVATLLIAVTITCLLNASGLAEQSQKGEWVSLFNGKDLDGWTPKIRYSKLGENFGNTFRVEDGLLKVRWRFFSINFIIWIAWHLP